jgi:hypothetical protein
MTKLKAHRKTGLFLPNVHHEFAQHMLMHETHPLQKVATRCQAVASEAPAQEAKLLSKTEQDFEGQKLHSEVLKTGDSYRVIIKQPLRGAVLHWGVNNWSLPPQQIWPEGTVQVRQTLLASTSNDILTAFACEDY